METLEIIIGLIFIFLLLSLLATTVQELIASIMGLRGKILLKALAKLLEIDNDEAADRIANSKAVQEFKDKILNSKVYRKYSGRFLWLKQLPSYLSADQVTSIINDLMSSEEEAAPAATTGARGGLESLTDSGGQPAKPAGGMLTKMKQSDMRNNLAVIYSSTKTPATRGVPGAGARGFATLEDLLDDEVNAAREKIKATAENIEDAVEKAKANFKKQYNEIMDRATGWYKRSVQFILLIIGMVIAISFDADTFKIYANLTSNPQARQELLGLAESFVNEDKISVYTAGADTSAVADTAEVSRLKGLVDSLLYNEIQNVPTPLGLGWQSPLSAQLKAAEDGGQKAWRFYIYKLFGWIVTALAVSLGAPFWFDMLQKVIRIRNAGNKPDEGEKAGS
ncbi:MAG TPA: hypothetical protein PKE06_27105 [Flavilitoribacter sp.]|nr:hypothetical protein [Flavilitoribacter sp.]HMQ91041.1 hypothetical protein [Flavilitoribacter sp.]